MTGKILKRIKSKLPINMNQRRALIVIPALLTLLIGIVSATTYQQATSSIMFKNALGLLVPLGIENYVPATDAIMYYNYIGVGLTLVCAAFSGMSNESRFTFFVPVFAGLMVFIGWIQAPDATSYWGMVIGCILLGALMYINDMNHEKYGLPGPGTKVLTIAMMIIVFEAAVVLVSNPSFNPFPQAGNVGTSQQTLTCGAYGYTCDSNGNIDLRASVSTVNSQGGTNLDAVAMGSWLLNLALSMIKFLILVLGAVLLFSVMLVASYPVLATSPQALLLLGVMQLIIWAVYMVAWFNWGFKPSFETAGV